MQVQQPSVEYLDFIRPKRKRTRRYPLNAVLTKESQQKAQTDMKPEIIDLCSDPESIVSQHNEPAPLRQELMKEDQLHSIPVKSQPMDIEQDQKQMLALLEQNNQNNPSKQKAGLISHSSQNKKQQQRKLPALDAQKQFSSTLNKLQVSTFINNCKVTLSTKPIDSFADPDALIIPFVTSQLEYYPGTLLKDHLIASRQKLAQSQMINGGVYIKNKLNIYNYRMVIFLKMDLEEEAKCLSTGLGMALKTTQKDNKKLSKIVYCLEQCMDLEDILTGINLSSQLKKADKIQFNITVQDEMFFKEKMEEFLSLTSQ